MTHQSFILGGGITGLAAGIASGLPILEAAQSPGGICSSYYLEPHGIRRSATPPRSQEAYRFEIGGGHWIFGGDPTVLRFIEKLTPIQRYVRESSVYFHQRDLYVPYPLQNYLGHLPKAMAAQAIAEMTINKGRIITLADWLRTHFGPTLNDLFFEPFHQRYTAGLHTSIAPQDAYKSPIDLTLVIRGALSEAPPVGYNTSFVYPQAGLNALAQAMASHCDMHYGKQVSEINVESQKLVFSDDSVQIYDTLISTLPLNRMMDMTGLSVGTPADPYTSVLVLNIGAKKGKRCPDDYWLYISDAKAPFHRIGFYSNVDPSFLPLSARDTQDRVSIYVERAYVGGEKPLKQAIANYGEAVVAELQDWGFIEEVEVLDPTWIDVAYTWSYPQSSWKQDALKALEAQGIYQIGRYGRWVFQGIADSIRDGFYAGAGFRI